MNILIVFIMKVMAFTRDFPTVAVHILTDCSFLFWLTSIILLLRIAAMVVIAAIILVLQLSMK